jgi:hypothetical protein
MTTDALCTTPTCSTVKLLVDSTTPKPAIRIFGTSNHIAINPCQLRCLSCQSCRLSVLWKGSMYVLDLVTKLPNPTPRRHCQTSRSEDGGVDGWGQRLDFWARRAQVCGRTPPRCLWVSFEYEALEWLFVREEIRVFRDQGPDVPAIELKRYVLWVLQLHSTTVEAHTDTLSPTSISAIHKSERSDMQLQQQANEHSIQ